jgi:hypothetical protein
MHPAGASTDSFVPIQDADGPSTPATRAAWRSQSDAAVTGTSAYLPLSEKTIKLVKLLRLPDDLMNSIKTQEEASRWMKGAKEANDKHCLTPSNPAVCASRSAETSSRRHRRP